MSHLNFDYVPLTFINDQEEIKKQIRNTLILIYLFEKYNNPARLEQLIEGTQYGYNASALQSGKNKFLRISDIHESKVNWETVPFCNCDDEKTYLLKKDDILIARTGGTTGKSFKIDNPPAHSIYAGYLIRIRAKQEVSPDYIYLFLHSFAYWSQIVNLNERNFRPKANAENLKSLILPDCPTDIQNDAVKISKGELIKGYEELHYAIEKALTEYEKTQEVQKLLSDQLTQLGNLTQAILQEAFQGKLVEPSKKEKIEKESFLEKIENEKKDLTTKRKYKPLIASEKNEIRALCYDIPENWQWFRLGEVAFFQEGPGIRVWQFTKSGIKLLNVQNILKDDTVDYLNSDKYVSEHEFNEKYRHFQIENGDILWASSGASWGKLAWHKDPGFSIMLNTSTVRLKFFSQELYDPYLFYFLKTEFFKIQMIPQLMGMQPNFGATHLSRSYIPIPPLSEQKRIVAEIERQFAKIKQIKDHIITNQQATEQLLKALLHKAFEVKEVETV